MPTATLEIASNCAEEVAAALVPETGRELPRTSVHMHSEKGCTVLRIEASDTSAMRAALNSYLECVRVTEDICRITEE